MSVEKYFSLHRYIFYLDKIFFTLKTSNSIQYRNGNRGDTGSMNEHPLGAESMPGQKMCNV